ncbi:aldo/keto reductase [Actinoplanes sp. CA-051413]|uniref:aldo/keto reductase n=1 Tax=Actinoplanes sp. CA-051413 TaxID=3239899 RepID=UPI003D98E1B2
MNPRPGADPARAARAGHRPGGVLPARLWLLHRRPAHPADVERLDDSDFRGNLPRFTGENFQCDLRIADQVQAVADQVGATSAQVGATWLLAKGDDIVPIPGTKRVSRVDENAVTLTPEQVAALTALPVAEGGHHIDEQMQVIEQ